MNSHRFPILGSEVPPLIGRQSLMQRLWSELTKPTPSNLSVVGPKRIGKTVCLQALKSHAQQQPTPYSIVVYWELGHAPPRSDDEFIAALCDLLRQEMRSSKGAFDVHQEYLEDGSHGNLKEVMDLLNSEEHPVLMIWDGFDKPLGEGLLTGHLFGQMRDLFHGKRHKVVTAARATQRELARNKQVYDSEFWNLFDPVPNRIGPFEDSDLTAAAAEAGISLSQGALKELQNWSGGRPTLVLTLLNHLAQAPQSGQVDSDDINRVATEALEEIGDDLMSIWEKDVSEGVRDAYRLLVDRGELPLADIAKEEADCLTTFGFANRVGNKLKLGCRLLQRHVQAGLPKTGSMSRLFGKWEGFRSEIRGVLELRLKQIPTVSAPLRRLVSRSLEDIPDFPDQCLNSLTSIEDHALDLIWEQEFGAHRQVPRDVQAYWTYPPRDRDSLIARMSANNSWEVPTSRAEQVRLLQLLTGSNNGFDSKSKRVSKDTYVLVNALHSFRNRNQHADGQSVHEGVAVAAMVMCVELLGCLAREFA